MGSDLIIDKEYKAWLSEIKLKVRNAQIKATLKVQTELLTFYWEFGADIVAKQTQAQWGDGLIDKQGFDCGIPGHEGVFPKQSHVYQEMASVL